MKISYKIYTVLVSFVFLYGAKVNVAGCVQTPPLYVKSIDEYLRVLPPGGSEILDN